MNRPEKPPGLFIAGTDTEVGKTYLSAVLVGLLKRLGRKAGYLKPVGSGAVDRASGPVSPDALFVVEQTGLASQAKDLCLILAKAPLAPAEALVLEGKILDWLALLTTCRQRLETARAAGEVVIVEGVGGLLVPLSPKHLVADLIEALGLPVLVVSRPSLGTINHSLLTLNELVRRGCPVAGFVFSGPGDQALDQANARWIEAFSQTRFRGWLPERRGASWEKVLDLAEASLDLKGLPGFQSG